MASLVWVYTCNGGRGSAPVLLSGSVYPTCQSGQGTWTQINVENDPDGYTSTDLMTAGILLVGAILIALGFMSGKQR